MWLSFVSMIAALCVPFSLARISGDDKSKPEKPISDFVSDENQPSRRLNSTTEVIGGTDAVPGAYPWFVDYGGCGGSLIYPDIVLSAAHCAGTANRVFVGSYITQSTAFGAEEKAIVGGAVHPQFDPSLRNDVLVLKLDSNSSMPPVALNNDTNLPLDGEDLLLVGHGIMNATTGELATVLQEALVPFINDNVCSSIWGSGLYGDVMLCAGPSVQFPDACNGDSGGPLLREIANNTYEQVGIVSWGEGGCDGVGLPTVYAEVAALKDWIEEQICSLSASPPADCPPPPPPPEGTIRVRVQITCDGWPSETGWYIRQDDVTVVNRPRGTFFTVRYGTVSEVVFLQPGEYNFTLTDSYGDGLCCGWGEGFVEIYAELDGGDEFLATVSGRFTRNITEPFTVPAIATQPTPPTKAPSTSPTTTPTQSPTRSPTPPTEAPTASPTKTPTSSPTRSPTPPTKAPSMSPTNTPTKSPTRAPTVAPSVSPTKAPTPSPSASPTTMPTKAPTRAPTPATSSPTKLPTKNPTSRPTPAPITPSGGGSSPGGLE